MDIPKHPRVRYLGFVSSEDKTAAMAAAAVTIHPSPLESLCIAALESMAAGTPILVKEKTLPLLHHCQTGNAGLAFGSYDEFEASLDLLLSDRRLRSILGENGRRYVQNNYSWEIVIHKYERIFNFLKGK
jgi:glycosyltransferase involved in cell wall biosynthesis